MKTEGVNVSDVTFQTPESRRHATSPVNEISETVGDDFGLISKLVDKVSDNDYLSDDDMDIETTLNDTTAKSVAPPDEVVRTNTDMKIVQLSSCRTETLDSDVLLQMKYASLISAFFYLQDFETISQSSYSNFFQI